MPAPQGINGSTLVTIGDPRINKWVFAGTASVWQYDGSPRNYPGWHMTCSHDAAQALLKLFELMRHSEFGGKASVDLVPPSAEDLSVPNCPARAVHASQLVVSHSKANMPPEHWHISDTGGILTLEVEADQLPQLTDGVSGISEGKGDFHLGGKGHELWLWW